MDSLVSKAIAGGKLVLNQDLIKKEVELTLNFDMSRV